jgi:hypothetical protein
LDVSVVMIVSLAGAWLAFASAPEEHFHPAEHTSLIGTDRAGALLRRSFAVRRSNHDSSLEQASGKGVTLACAGTGHL